MRTSKLNVIVLDIQLYTKNGYSYGLYGDETSFTCQYSNYSEFTIAPAIYWGEEELTTINDSAPVQRGLVER